MEREYEVDLLGLFRQMLKRWFLILLVTVLCAAAGFVYVWVTFTPSVTTELLLTRNEQEDASDSSDLPAQVQQDDLKFIRSMLILQKNTDKQQRERENVYQYILENTPRLLTSDSALQSISDELGQNTALDDLRLRISVTREDGAALYHSGSFKITTTGRSREEAEQLNDAICDNAVEILQAGQSLDVIKLTSISRKYENDSVNKKVPVLAAVLGFICAAGAVFLQEMLDNRIRQRRDIVKGLKLPVLAVIPQISHKS